MKRYDMTYAQYDLCVSIYEEEDPDGRWVRWEDVAPLLRDALAFVEDVAHRHGGGSPLAADIRQALGEDDE